MKKTAERRLRVLHLGRFHDTYAVSGGIGRHVSELLTALAGRIDVDNLVAAPGWRGDTLRCGGYRVFRVPCLGVIASTAIAPGMIRVAQRLHAARPYDIVHLHFPDPMGQLVAEALPREVRRVVTWHSDIVRQRRLLRLYRPWLERFLRDVDCVIASSVNLFQTSQQLAGVPPERRVVIPFGIDYARFAAPAVLQRAEELRKTIDRRQVVVFAIGRHVYYKGFDHLIRAIASLPQAYLVLGGSGPLTTELKRLAQSSGITHRVRFTGPLGEHELAAWFHACDIFCLPSSSQAETFGLVQLEAMGCGKPVVCTRLGTGVNEVCVEGVTGLTAEPGDATSLADCIGRLIADGELRRRLGSAGRQRAHEMFSAQRMAEQTLAIYRRIIER